MTSNDQGTRDERIPHRTWRDLPASPPVTDQFPAAEAHAAAATTAVLDAPVAPPAPPAAPEEPAHPHRRRNVFLWVAIAAAASAAIITWVVLSTGDGTTTPTVDAGAANPGSVAAALGPAVVQIEIFGGLDAGGGVGSGVIYDEAGLVLTAHHVVSFGDEVTVRTADDREFTGRVVGRAPERDLAVVALVDATDLTAATIAEPGSVEVGEPAYALGSPFGFQQSVTAGIISGLDRELETPVGLLTGLIQTDAPINPGNSGGPLADAEAKVIGINTAIASMSGGNDGVGFAIPVEDFADLLDEVEAAGGMDAPTVPAPEGSGLESLIPGLSQIPGLDQLQDMLDELLNPGGQGGTGQEIPGLDQMDQMLQDMLDELFRPSPSQQDLQELPNLDQMLEDLYGTADIPQELQDMLDQLFGLPVPDTTPNGGSDT